jgi:ectoine hydroxylase-related dioxygenase (phytanoyl-CoA dioxygenase family)
LEVEGFGPWTVKSGWHHVAPPADVLTGLITVRVHLDPVTASNAPLLIAPGSHLLGRISESQIDAVVARLGTVACLADAGDVWVYSTPILHASEVAHEPSRRRVLQVDYAIAELPGGLQWLGV